jgi:quercetin dioxygenase-like cupin family protein
MNKFFFPDTTIESETLEEGRSSRKIRAHGGSLMMVEVMFEAGALGYEHTHVHEQVCYCLAGEFEFSVDGQKTHLRPGDSVYIPPSAPHGVVCLSQGRLLDVFTPQRDDFLKK